MYKFTDFLNQNRITEAEDALGAYVHGTTPAPANTKTVELGLTDMIKSFIEKHKGTVDPTHGGQYFLDLKKFGNKQYMTINIEPNFEIKCYVYKQKTVANKEVSYCQLESSNIPEVSKLITQPQQSTNINDPRTGKPAIIEPKKIYFRVFPTKDDKTNSITTKFYFYDTLDFLRNPAQSNHIWWKPYKVKSAE